MLCSSCSPFRLRSKYLCFAAPCVCLRGDRELASHRAASPTLTRATVSNRPCLNHTLTNLSHCLFLAGLTFPVRGAFSFQAATAFPVQANAFPAAAAYGQNCGQGFGAGYGAQGFPNPYGAASSAFPFFGGGGAVYGANGAFGALGGFGVAPAAGFGGLQSGASGQYPFYGGPGSLAGPPEGYSNLSLNQSNPI